MKLTPEKASVLIEVLNAQSGISKIEDKEVYKAKVAVVSSLLNTKDGKATGGITAETYKDNKDNKELVAAAKAHTDKAKAREAKAAEKVEKEASKQRTPEQEKESAEAIVAFMNAVTGKARITKTVGGKQVDDPTAFRHVANKSRRYIDHKKGGLKNVGPEGKNTPWERFKDFPGVKEAAKAHQAYIKAKAKNDPSPEM